MDCHYGDSPDGRLWASVESAYQDWDWTSIRLPDPQGEGEGQFLAENRQYFTAPEEPVRIEIDCGSETLSKKYGEQIASALESQGYRIGPEGWRLVVSHKVTNSGGSLILGRSETPIPQVDYAWLLVDAKGNEVWQAKGSSYFLGTGSRYYTKTRTAYDFAPNEPPLTAFESMEYYDFGNRDAREAIAEEILEFGPRMEFLERWPKLLLKVGDSYPMFPVNLSLTIKSGDPKETVPKGSEPVR